MSVMKHFAMTTSKLAPKVTVWAVIFYHISSYFAHRQRRKNIYHPLCLKKCFDYQNLEKNCFYSLAVEHTSSYKNVGVQSNRTAYSLPNFKFQHPQYGTTVTRLSPVFQPILTVTIVTVNMGWNTGFSPVTDLNKSCSLLTMLKPKIPNTLVFYSQKPKKKLVIFSRTFHMESPM